VGLIFFQKQTQETTIPEFECYFLWELLMLNSRLSRKHPKAYSQNQPTNIPHENATALKQIKIFSC
jgi:hypothetical protein